MSSEQEIKLARIEEESAKHADVLEAMGKVSSTERFNIPKNKKSQQENSVNNVIVINDTDKVVKYTVTISAVASPLSKNGTVPALAEDVLLKLQASFVDYLNTIKDKI